MINVRQSCTAIQKGKMRKVYCYIGGGLGNQLFNYAAARSMAIDAGAKLYLRQDLFVGDGYKRQFALDDFNCADYVVVPARPKFVRVPHYMFHTRIARAGLWRFLNTVVDREWARYHPMPKKWIGSLSISGPWQSEKYFEHHAQEIYEEFQLRDDSWLRRDSMYAEIRNSKDSVFLHVRSYKDTRFKDGSYALPISYYIKALEFLRSEVPQGSKIFVFSDDLPWAVARLGDAASQNGFMLIPVEPDETLLPRGTYSSQYLRDFRLMQFCQHGIVADSTFSWWAGWLGEYSFARKGSRAIRLCPDKGGQKDFYPQRWIPIAYKGDSK